MNKTITGLLSVFAIIGWTETALAEDYTGCVTPGGTIIDIALGQSPARPCQNKHHIIHLDSNANQHVSAEIDLTALCKTLQAASIPPDLSLGCHSVPDVEVLGDVQRVWAPYDSFDENNETCGGMLKIAEDADRWGAGNLHWQLTGEGKRGATGGAFVERTHKIINAVEAPNDCALLCEDDEQCIGAIYDNPLDGSVVERECRIFHYSDSDRITPWNEFCAAGSPDFCKQKIDSLSVVWFLKAECDVDGSDS